MTASAEVDLPLGRRQARAAIVAVGIAALAVAYYGQARSVFTTSEGGSQALQAWGMLHGNTLLRGWSLSDVSFYTTELPEYALVELVRGLNTWTVPTAAAITYFLQVVLAGWLAKGRASGREGWVRVLIAVGIMLAPPLGAPTLLLMASPDHVGTHVPLLLIYLALDRIRPRWWLPVLIMVVLTWATVADALVIYEGAVPIAAVCALRAYQARDDRRARLYELSLALGAAASVGLARVVLAVINNAGGFYVRTPVAEFATPHQVSAALWTKLGNVLLVYGADFFGVVFGSSALMALVHLTGVVLVFWALAVVIRRYFAEDDRIAQMLALGFVVVLAAYLLGNKPDSNEIVGLLPIGAVLAARVLARPVIRTRLVSALALVLVILAISLGANATWPARINPSQKVASWLDRHNLTYGLAAYWNATAVTVETGGEIKVRPVRTYQASVVTTNFEIDSNWYDPDQHYANFVIWHPTHHCGNLCLTSRGLRAAFGPPARIVNVSPYQVLIYHRNLLTSISEVAWCTVQWPWTAPGPPTTNLDCTGTSRPALVLRPAAHTDPPTAR